jgi:rhodanese-related sulfurtransferase
VQETDHVASVRGARLVLADDDGVRANMSPRGWRNGLGGIRAGRPATDALQRQGAWVAPVPAPPQAELISPQTLADGWPMATPWCWISPPAPTTSNAISPVPGGPARAIGQALANVPAAQRYVLTCGSSQLARLAVAEVEAITGKPVFLLQDGTTGWINAQLPLEEGETHLASPRIDRYRRPYEGTDNPREAMQAYLDWEFGLVEQLARDGTHGFYVI